jgi:hypothetical protein
VQARARHRAQQPHHKRESARRRPGAPTHGAGNVNAIETSTPWIGLWTKSVLNGF